MGPHPHIVSDRQGCARASVLFGDLSKMPYDRARLDVIAASSLGDLPILDLGSTSEQVTRYVAGLGRSMIAVGCPVLPSGDLSDPGAYAPIVRRLGGLSALDFPSSGAGGLMSMYGLSHFERAEMPGLLGEVARVLAASAPFLIALLRGTGSSGAELDGLGARGTLYERAEVTHLFRALEAFTEIRVESRRPYPGEAPFHRLFVTGLRA